MPGSNHERASLFRLLRCPTLCECPPHAAGAVTASHTPRPSSRFPRTVLNAMDKARMARADAQLISFLRYGFVQAARPMVGQAIRPREKLKRWENVAALDQLRIDARTNYRKLCLQSKIDAAEHKRLSVRAHVPWPNRADLSTPGLIH